MNEGKRKILDRRNKNVEDEKYSTRDKKKKYLKERRKTQQIRLSEKRDI